MTTPATTSPSTDDSTALDKSGKTIQEMFGAVAPRYDLLNHLLTGALDFVWRRRVAKAIETSVNSSLDNSTDSEIGLDGEPVLDLCCGTGDQATALAKRGAEVTAADFCVPMLAIAQKKFAKRTTRQPTTLTADALHLPTRRYYFAAATVSFGLRNVADLDQALREIAGTLRPGGTLVVLEATEPVGRIIRPLYLFYFRRILPIIGRLLSPRGSAYDYLQNSVRSFPQRDDFLARMTDAGFTATSTTEMSFGAVCMYQGTKSQHGSTQE